MQTIKIIEIWDKGLRLSHWLMAAGVTFLLVSAWFMKNTEINYQVLYDWHLIIGQSLVFVLGYRLFLMFKLGTGNWKGISRMNLAGMVDMLKFYLSLGRFPLPNWFSYNPFWAPLYVLFYLVMILALATGLIYTNNISFVIGFAVKDVHVFMASVIAGFVLLHPLAAFWHDWRGDSATISPMIGGKRFFIVEQKADVVQQEKPVTVDVLSIL